MIIRKMQTDEIDLVINLFAYYIDECGIDPDHYDENRLLATVKQYNIRPNLFFRIALDGRRPIGVIGGFLSEDPVESETAATIQFFYLLPDYATVDNYGQLVEQIIEWAKMFKVTKIRAIDIGNNPNRLSTVYEQLGFDAIRISIMNKELA